MEIPTLKLPRPRSEPWVYYCEACSDAGKVSHWCGPDGPTRTPWQDAAFCGRPQDHAPHEWVAPCACADHNPAIQRRKALAAALVRPQTKTTRGDH
jgi:hypothetical protein